MCFPTYKYIYLITYYNRYLLFIPKIFQWIFSFNFPPKKIITWIFLRYILMSIRINKFAKWLLRFDVFLIYSDYITHTLSSRNQNETWYWKILNKWSIISLYKYIYNRFTMDIRSLSFPFNVDLILIEKL